MEPPDPLVLRIAVPMSFRVLLHAVRRPAAPCMQGPAGQRLDKDIEGLLVNRDTVLVTRYNRILSTAPGMLL